MNPFMVGLVNILRINVFDGTRNYLLASISERRRYDKKKIMTKTMEKMMALNR